MERACVLLPPGGGKREKDRTIPTYVAVKINGGNNPQFWATLLLK